MLSTGVTLSVVASSPVSGEIVVYWGGPVVDVPSLLGYDSVSVTVPVGVVAVRRVVTWTVFRIVLPLTTLVVCTSPDGLVASVRSSSDSLSDDINDGSDR